MLAAWKPWAAQGTAAGSGGLPIIGRATFAAAPPTATASPAQPPAVAYLSAQIPLSWAELESDVGASPHPSSVVQVVPGAGQPVVATALLGTLPTTQALGQSCDSAPVVLPGYEGFGLTVPPQTATVSVERLFAVGAPLPVSTEVSIDSARRLAIVSLRQESWPVGHYTLVLGSTLGAQRYVPFCVPSADAATDASPIAAVPLSADAPSARMDLWDPAQP